MFAHLREVWGGPNEMPCSAVSTPGTTTSATSGALTLGCSPHCTSSLPWAARISRCPHWSPSFPATSRPAKSTPKLPIPATLNAIEEHFAGADTDRLDGLTVQLGTGTWFNLRPSNTEPLLRLNVEAPDVETMTRVRDDVLALVRR